jgi:hypothetical protein
MLPPVTGAHPRSDPPGDGRSDNSAHENDRDNRACWAARASAMLDVMSAMFGVLSLSIFIAHAAIDAYRLRRPNTFG